MSSEKFNEICLFDDKDAKQILIAIKRDEVKVLELNQCGFIVSDVFSLRIEFSLDLSQFRVQMMISDWPADWPMSDALFENLAKLEQYC